MYTIYAARICLPLLTVQCGIEISRSKMFMYTLLHLFCTGSQPWASCQIHKIAGAHAPGMPGTFSPSPQVSDPDMHHGTCVTHVPWCMPGSLTSGFLWNRRRGKTFPAFRAHAYPAILRIWQEDHAEMTVLLIHTRNYRYLGLFFRFHAPLPLQNESDA